MTPTAPQRLLAANTPALTEHHARFGRIREGAADTLTSVLGEAGLTGRGGGGFPTARKIASVTGRKPVVVGNGAEGEPLSRKDAVLVTRAPHLVLDGLHVAAEAVRADNVYLYVPKVLVPIVHFAVGERSAAGLNERRVVIVETPDAFVAGEESAVVRRIEGGRALPRDRTVPTSTSGARGRPTLVNNVETLAHIALIARYGPQWFRSLGDSADPGTMLVTLSGAGTRRSVIELPTGTPFADVLARRGIHDAGEAGAVLVGGYHGSWVTLADLVGAHLSRASLARYGATPGAGVLHVLPMNECGLARTADILTYLAEQGARQCGPCRHGLPALAQLFDDLAYRALTDGLLDEVHRMLGLVDGRGACRHPDGTVRLARSALSAFASDITQHRAGRCNAALALTREADLR